MKKSTKCLLSLIVSGLMIAPMLAQTTAPSEVKPKVAKTQVKLDNEALQAFVKDVRPQAIKVSSAVRDKAEWSNADKRKEIGDKIQDDLKALIDRTNQMLTDGKSTEAEVVGAAQFYTWAAVFGNDEMKKQLDEMSQKSGTEGIWAKTAQATAAFYLAGGDSAGQGKALDSLEALVTADPEAKGPVAQAELDLYRSKPSKEIADRIDTYVSDTLKVPAIKQIKEQQAAAAKQEALVGQPMVLEGRLKDGSHFSTADLKGKVILVDFWASWCGPCKAELPRVKKEYAEMHDKGVEVIGVSFDQTDAALTKFLGENPDMPWPQFYDPEHPFWKNEFGKKYGIEGIPTMFLIDKNGICRSVKAREDFEKEIPKLLDEKGAL